MQEQVAASIAAAEAARQEAMQLAQAKAEAEAESISVREKLTAAHHEVTEAQRSQMAFQADLQANRIENDTRTSLLESRNKELEERQKAAKREVEIVRAETEKGARHGYRADRQCLQEGMRLAQKEKCEHDD